MYKYVVVLVTCDHLKTLLRSEFSSQGRFHSPELLNVPCSVRLLGSKLLPEGISATADT